MKIFEFNVILASPDAQAREEIGFILESLGCRVIYCRDGLEAVRAQSAGAGRPDLAVLETEMPAMGGAEALRIMRERDPGLRALMITDGGCADEFEGLAEEGVQGALRKPVRAAELFAAVRKALDGAAAHRGKTPDE